MKYNEIFEKTDVDYEAWKKFGYKLFGSYMRSNERDTDFERRVFGRVERFIQNQDRDGRLIQSLNTLKQYKDMYPGILKPNAKRVYRGTAISGFKIFELINSNTLSSRNGIYKIPYRYKSLKRVQSWSTNINVAWDFAKTGDRKSNHFSLYTLKSATDKSQLKRLLTIKNIPIVLSAHIDDNFLFNTRFTNKLVSDNGFEVENEILYIGDDYIDCTLYIDKDIIQIIETKIKEMGDN